MVPKVQGVVGGRKRPYTGGDGAELGVRIRFLGHGEMGEWGTGAHTYTLNENHRVTWEVSALPRGCGWVSRCQDHRAFVSS